MRISAWLVILGVAFLAGLPALAGSQCPNLQEGESAEDCPWSPVARSLQDLDDGDKPVLPAFESKLPGLARGMRADLRHPELLKLWGKSINFDEYAHGQIVRPSILRAIAGLMGLDYREERDPAGHPVVNAGMEHTYGYLFSTLKTPFGYKRARWVKGEIDRGFGLPAGTLSPLAKEGTLFQNVSAFAGRIAFRHDGAELARLENAASGAAKVARTLDISALKPVRLEEAVSAKDPATNRERTVVLRTDLVPFTKQGEPTDKDAYLVVYSVLDPAQGGARLITAFPVAADFARKVADPSGLGEGKPVQTRYNGFVPGVSGAQLSGTRRITEGKVE